MRWRQRATVVAVASTIRRRGSRLPDRSWPGDHGRGGRCFAENDRRPTQYTCTNEKINENKILPHSGKATRQRRWWQTLGVFAVKDQLNDSQNFQGYIEL